uniref:Putative ovule protein n=1 Tax=Solanum chacoense TaxID=4108 RepID=A0A0V0HEP4_SOLCH
MIMGLLTKMEYLQTDTIIDKSHMVMLANRGIIDILHPMLIWTYTIALLPYHEIPPPYGVQEMEVVIHVLILFIVLEDAASCLLMSMF